MSCATIDHCDESFLQGSVPPAIVRAAIFTWQLGGDIIVLQEHAYGFLS